MCIRRQGNLGKLGKLGKLGDVDPFPKKRYIQVVHNIHLTETSKNTAPKGALIALKKAQIQGCTTVRLVSGLSVTANTSTVAYRIGATHRLPSAKGVG